jgi:fatty acid synthase subunit beta
VGAVMTTQALVDVVFLRGMTMQNAVVRDKDGRSDFAMMAVNPSRVVPKGFGEPQLTKLVNAIDKLSAKLLQVVFLKAKQFLR